MVIARAVLLFLLWLPSSAAAQSLDVTSRAWDLYAAARYADALALLDGPAAAAVPAADRQLVNEYRVLCLVALERGDAAASAMAAILDTDALYVLKAASQPPRVVAQFERVRQQRLPVAVELAYAEATSAFEQQRFEEAERQLRLVLRLVARAQPGADAPHAAWLALLKTRSEQFLDIVRARVQDTTPSRG